ncbi:imidazole glycerol phosphate synthase subunit HisH [Subsaxibacter sp. CAU 1640]|uniref:imidazole glycerol phosphate synthase subunit HisH n=1 Tax=Subsaxibacter sp. CAU 1640 TaxID=2933271 RepID=UPI0020042D6F|nr:imidazole glycerol phosphate synthase subunit HisH [Subsaxibacter sp. CAU 1640]MCK7591004.1 imidazole glycerol phosphate synthase subunit HisH [Subsaxibacter sp. CAU 1640]
MKVVIIDYGAGNIKSIQFAFNRLGIEVTLSNDREDISSADRVIFPGVGEASSAMKMLKNSQLDSLIPTLKQPVFGICLGMQLMCQYTEEGKTNGLNIFETNVKRFSNNLKVPHMGWNTIRNLKSDLFETVQTNEYQYFVHSFYAELSSETIAITDYDISYSAALKKDNFYGVQFHPEKSGAAGEQILKNFIEIKS